MHIHIHARKPDGTPSYEIEDFQAITDAIRAEVGDAAIINYSTGTIGVPVAKRIEYLRACRPEVAALNMGSMNYAKYSRSKKQFVFNMVFENPFGEIIELLEAMNELGIKPEHECFDVGHVGSLAPLIDMGVLKQPLHVDCVMGVVGGIPPTARNLAAMVDNIPGGLALGRDRDLARPVDAGVRGADARRLDPRGPGGQPVPAERRDGEVQRRADREGQADDRRHGPAPGERAGGPRDAGDPAARGEPRVMSLPLEGIRVLDLSRLLPGGFCSLLLADFGADVVKVEDTGMGDYIRWSPPYYEGAHDSAKSALFLSLNRNKRSIRLDLKSEGGREALLALVRDADVVLESFRPGVLDRLGVGYERMREENPGIVYCAISGYGQDGPKRDASGHDMNYLGLIGLLGLTGERGGGEPVQAAGQIADLGGGALMAAFGIMAALRERDGSAQVTGLGRGAAGRRVDVRRRAVVACDGGGGVLRRRHGSAPRRSAAGGLADLLPPV